MGLEVVVSRPTPPDLAAALARLAATGMTATVVMVDGRLHAPGAAVPPTWRDVRLSTVAGMLSLRRRPDGVAVVVFGNAGDALVAAQRALADCLDAD